jgi:hypothetical protein
MTKNGLLLTSLFAASLLHAIPATARTITVRCNQGMTISEALGWLNPAESHTIRVTGTCHDAITIGGFTQSSERRPSPDPRRSSPGTEKMASGSTDRTCSFPA